MKLPSILNKSRTRIFMQLALNGLAQAATTIVTILLVRLAFDRLITTSEGVQRDIMLQVGLGLGLAAICIGWLRMVERVDAEKMGQSYIHQIRMLLFKHMSRLAPRVEGLFAALRIIGDQDAVLSNTIKSSVQSAMNFLLRAQIAKGKYAGGMPRAVGGLGSNEAFNRRVREIRIDYVQHALSAMIQYEQML